MPTVEYLSYEVVEENGWDVYDTDCFERAREMDLEEEEYGEFEADEDEYILEAAEREGHDWSYECRAGTCATCAAVVVEGDVVMDAPPILSPEEEEKGFRLTCIGLAKSDAKIVYGAKGSEDLDILI